MFLLVRKLINWSHDIKSFMSVIGDSDAYPSVAHQKIKLITVYIASYPVNFS